MIKYFSSDAASGKTNELSYSYAKDLVAELAHSHAQCAWGRGGKGFELWG